MKREAICDRFACRSRTYAAMIAVFASFRGIWGAIPRNRSAIGVPEPYVMLSQERIEEVLAHRGRNLMIDTVASSGTEGESTLSIARGDSRGRDYFLHEVPGLNIRGRRSCLFIIYV